MNRYALLDWDYTLRDGYTLTAWIEYLCAHHVVSDSLPASIASLQARYDAGKISHDGFCREQAGLIYPFTELLFQLLHLENIDAIVVSGAPYLILKQYQEVFHIRKILAFEPEIRNGQYTGAANANYGFHKENAVQLATELYGTAPFLALGDSSSDIPLLLTAQHAVCIGQKSFLPDGKEAVCLSPASAPENIIAEISSLIHSV